MVVVVVLKDVAVDLVGAALGFHVDGGATGKALFGLEAVRRHVHLLNGIQRRDVGIDVRRLDVVCTHAVNLRIVLVVAGPVDVERKRASRIGWIGVVVNRRAEAWLGAINLLIVSSTSTGPATTRTIRRLTA